MPTISEADLHAYVDGQLPPTRVADVEQWLAAHPEDAQRVQSYQAINREILAAYPLPDASLPRPSTLGDDLPTRRMTEITAAPRWAQAAALTAFALLGASAGWFLRPILQPNNVNQSITLTQQLAEPALVSHRVYTPEVLHPVEVRKDQQQHLVGWLSKRLGKPVNAPNLDGVGFSLMGGRLLPATDGPAAQFMYENEAGRRLTLYVRQADDKTDQTAFRRFSKNGLNSFYWVDGGLGYALTGDLSPEQLMDSAHRVYQQLSF